MSHIATYQKEPFQPPHAIVKKSLRHAFRASWGSLALRFDDSLETVLAGDVSSPVGMQSAWRQLVDLIGRRRAPASPAALERLRRIREHVPPPVRAASARALAFANPPEPLVRLFAEDDLTIAAPVLRVAQLSADEWMAILPIMPSTNRSILRHRRDLEATVKRALESFGPSDFVLPPAELTLPTVPIAPPTQPVSPVQAANDELPSQSEAPETALVSEPVASDLPSDAEAPVTVDWHDVDSVPENPVSNAQSPTVSTPQDGAHGTFQISDIVARIDAFQREREGPDGLPAADSTASDPEPESFRFETDSHGVICWVAGVARGALIGLSLDSATYKPGAQVDGAVSGAFRRRAGFDSARLLVAGTSNAAGQWRVSGIPVFDRSTGRFTGYRGTGRRPRADERAEPGRQGRTPGADAVRQLVHELRTPTTAIAGFAEMIEGQLLGPVPGPYRDYASTIRQEARGLLGAIEDLDTAARLDSNALDLRGERVGLASLLAGIIEDLEPLAEMRGVRAALFVEPGMAVLGDHRAVERLIGRLLATMLAAGGAGETIMITAAAEKVEQISLTVDRPRALAIYPGDALLTVDADTLEGTNGGEGAGGGPLLGIGFALRLARNLANQMGGSLTIGGDRLTLRLPAAVTHDVGQASTN